MSTIITSIPSSGNDFTFEPYHEETMSIDFYGNVPAREHTSIKRDLIQLDMTLRILQ